MLANEATFAGYARTRGRLYLLDGYPGLVPAGDPQAWVHGEVYVLEDSPGVLARLDDYEGCGRNDPRPHDYERVRQEVILEAGASDLAWVYVYRGAVAGRTEIPSGDYCRPAQASWSQELG